MANRTLVVEVVSAYGLVDNLDLLNACVELHFAGQRFTTKVTHGVRCPVWNETISFNVPDRPCLSKLNLEAYVCNVIDGFKPVLAMVQLSGSSFTDSPDEVVKDYQLKGSIFRRSKGILHLKVFLKNESPAITSDPLSDVIQDRNLSQRVHIEPMDLGPAVKEIKPKFEHGLIVEYMPYVFVRVVKARNLPHVKACGGIDPRVKVKFGDYSDKTEYFHNERNPEWKTTFTFSKPETDQLTIVYVVVSDVDYVVVSDVDKVIDEFVGMVLFDIGNITDESRVPNWYNLLDASGKAMESQLMLAVWMGSPADEEFPDARKLDSSHLDISLLPHFGTKVYDLPSLWYLRVNIAEFTCIAVDAGARLVEMYVTAAIGSQSQKTKILKKSLAHYAWKECLMFVAAEPFDDDLQISVKARLDPDGDDVLGPDGDDKVVGHISINLNTTLQGQVGGNEPPAPQWFDLQIVDGGGKLGMSSCRISVGNCLEGRYHVRFDSLDYNGDLRPASKQIPDPPVVGILEVGILSVHGIRPIKKNGQQVSQHPYCVAKYGRKWLRTRTIYNSLDPVFNEQHTWEVYDTATALTVGVFHNSEIEGCSSEEGRSVPIGRVRICLSTLQPGQTYAHSYSLLALTPDEGVKKRGELHLAVRFLSKSIVRFLGMYSSPMLPKIHYEHQLPTLVEDNLRLQAVKLVVSHMNRMEPPLRKEVVEYMCSVGNNYFSLRKCKANLFRVMHVISGLISLCKWFEGVRSWKKPVKTLVVVHVVFFGALLYHQFILPALFLYMFFITVRNYRWRPRFPPHILTRLSYADVADRDELREEFDTFPTSQRSDLIPMRYDRLRSLAGRIQTIVGDVASHAERIQLLASWRDPTATAIFGLFTLSAAIVLYFTPWKILVGMGWLYITWHPKLQPNKWTTSFLFNFYMRLPNKTCALL